MSSFKDTLIETETRQKSDGLEAQKLKVINQMISKLEMIEFQHFDLRINFSTYLLLTTTYCTFLICTCAPQRQFCQNRLVGG